MAHVKHLLIGFLSGVGLISAAFAGHVWNVPANAANADLYKHLNLFGEVFEQVRSEYVVEPDDVELIRAAIDGMVNGLDPHSDYLTPEEYKETRTEVRGEFGGLGIRFLMENGLVKVITALEGTPAESVGIQTGDLITHIDKEPIKGLSTEQAVKRMRGPVGSSVGLSVYRESDDGETTFDVKIVRALIKDIPVQSEVRASNIGYIKIRQFNDRTMAGIRQAFEKFGDHTKASKTELIGYILDLRSNPGGLLDQAVKVSDAFLERGEVLTTRGRQAETLERFSATGGDIAENAPLVVLINGASASASEIVAGALQDMERATVIGTRSFGKGSVQSIIPLGSNGALRLTTARFYTPSGRSIQTRGIAPDIVVKQPLPEGLREQDFEAGGEASLRGHLDGGPGEEQRSASSYFVPRETDDDEQLKYAVSLLQGDVEHEAFRRPASAP